VTVATVAAVVVALLIGTVLCLELRRVGDLLEAINHAIERVAVQMMRRR
jgi:hypothetical protein